MVWRRGVSESMKANLKLMAWSGAHEATVVRLCVGGGPRPGGRPRDRRPVSSRPRLTNPAADGPRGGIGHAETKQPVYCNAGPVPPHQRLALRRGEGLNVHISGRQQLGRARGGNVVKSVGLVSRDVGVVALGRKGRVQRRGLGVDGRGWATGDGVTGLVSRVCAGRV